MKAVLNMARGRDTRCFGLGILRDRRGVGTVGCVFSLLVFGAGVYVAYLFAVVLYDYNAFEQAVAEMIPYYKHHKADFIHGAVLEIANEDFDLGLKEEQVKVVIEGNRIIIDIEYDRQVELPFYTHTIKFSPHFTGAAS